MTKRSIKAIARRALSADKKLREAQDNRTQKTLDSFQNFAAALGIGTSNLMSNSTYGFNPITRIRTLLEWIHRGSWLGGVAVDLVADDMTRAGVDIKGELEPDQIEELQENIVAKSVWSAINDTEKWARLYGGALGVILIDGQDPATPFKVERVGKGGFRGLLPLDRWMVEPSLEDLVQDYGPFMGMPKFYRVTTDAPALHGKKIHYTRCLRLEGIRLPYWQRMMENLWGLSVIERLYDRMVPFDSASMGAAQLAYKSYLRTYKIKGLRQLIAAGGPAYQGLLKQVQFMRETQSNEGITLLDGEDEMETLTAPNFSGLSDVLLQMGQQLSGALQIPLVRLFGQSPAGLNSTGESDLRMYYDGIKQAQERDLRNPLTTIYRAEAQSSGIALPEGFRLDFRPLWQLTEQQKAEIAERMTAAVVSAHGALPVSDRTALQELKQTSAVTGLWTNIREEDIEAASDVPASPISEGVPGEEGANQGGEKKTPPTKDSVKINKEEAEYVDVSKKKTHCGICEYFEKNGSCEKVEGTILAAGGCKLFHAIEGVQ
jgi:hypothetical protein